MRVPFSYLERQFSDIEPYLDDLRCFVKTCDFTLGKPLLEFEQKFADLVGLPYAVGVSSGTDALILSMKACGIGPGDEVITTPMTFVATVGSIAMVGAKPVLVDSEDGFVIDPDKIEAAITPRTKAIIPVHFTGNVADMPRISEIAKKHGLILFEDACQAVEGRVGSMPIGSWSETASFSLHPLKNLNVWSDGGLICTRNEKLAEKLRLYRNHGLVNRNEVAFFGYNARLDTWKAVIANRVIKTARQMTEKRKANAKTYDNAFADMAPYIRIPSRRPDVGHVFHLYVVRASRRDELLAFLQEKGVEAKVHYPIPLHLQEAARYLGYKKGDFPVCESDIDQIITLPAHPYLTDDEIGYTIEQVRKFYGK